jgi:two-component system chemotaxis response regulator CheY
MTILIVDDSRIMRNLIKNYFTELGTGHCDYVDAENGEEAFKLVQNRSIDLVFLDWNMPKMSGIEFLKQIRSISQYKQLPIVMVTSEISKTNVIEALKNGATDYIIKPIDDKIFKEKILKILKK